MKKALVLLFAQVLLLTSCGKLSYLEIPPSETVEAPTEEWIPADLSKLDGIGSVFSIHQFVGTCPDIQVDGDFVYTWSSTAFYRFHLLTGKLARVCTDPLCIGEACPFANGSNNWLVRGNFVYYIREKEDLETDPDTGRVYYHRDYSIHLYDMKNQKDTCLYEIPDDGTHFTLYDILSDGFLYYTRSQYVENAAEEKAYYERFVCRTKPNEIGKGEEVLYHLPGNSVDSYSDLLEVNDEYFYFRIGESNRIARLSRVNGSTDFLTFPYYYISTARIGEYCYYQSCGKEPVDYVTSIDGRGDVIVDENGNPVLTPIYRLYYTKRNLITGEETILGESPLAPMAYPAMLANITDRYLYLDFEDGLWRCDHEGNKIRLVRSKEQSAAHPLGNHYNEQLIYGNWIFEGNDETFVVYDMESGKYFPFELK